MLRIIAVLAAFAALAGPAAASTSTASYTLSVDNNVVIHKSAPNLQATITETNNTSTAATCYVYIEELNHTTQTFTIAAGGGSTQTGIGAAFPSTKLSWLTYDLYCNNGVLVATAKSKVVMTDHVG